MNIILSNKKLFENKILLATVILIFLIPITLIIGNAATNINIVLISFFIVIKLFKDKELEIFLTKHSLIVLLFFGAIIIKDTLFLFQFNTKSFYLIKFYFLFISVDYVFSKHRELVQYFSSFLLLILVIFSADIIFQYFFGKDFFNISSESVHRFSGFMGTEWIAGSYISKFAIISLLAIITKNKFNYISISLLLFFFLVIILSGERMALLNYFLVLLLFFIAFSYKGYFSFKKIFFLLSILLLSFVVFFQSLDDKRKKIYTIDVLIKLKLAEKFVKIFNLSEKDQETIKRESIKKNSHLDIFISSYKIYKDNILFGTGTDKFFEKCKKFKKEKLYCESHSHNIYLNIISEQGTIIFLIFIYLIYFNLFKVFKNNKNNESYLITLIVLIVFLNPLSISGDIFSTWTGAIFWYIFGICSGLTNKVLNNKN
jgi:O-antigen ligase